LIPHVAPGVALVWFVTRRCALGWLLRALPGGPRFALDPVDLLQFQVPRFVEVTDGRGPPVLADEDEILRDGRLRAAELRRDLHLGPPLDVEIGDFLAPFEHRQDVIAFDRH